MHEDCFTLWSDVDIAAWGILPQDTFKAIGEVRELDKSIEINLVDIETCKPELLEKILREGREVWLKVLVFYQSESIDCLKMILIKCDRILSWIGF